MGSDRKRRRPKRPCRQDKELGALFQVFEVHSSEAPLYSADKPPPRKRKRVESSKCEHTNELKSMWTYLEGLAAQLGVLEEVTQVRDYQDSVTYKTVLAGAAIISHNIPILEQEEKANLNSLSPPSLPLLSRVYRCPAFNCTQYFQRLDLFHQHIRGSHTNGHKILKNIIDQTCCLRCDESFTRSKDLVNHERSLQGEQYGSRVFKFTGSQGQDDQGQGQDDRGQGQDDQGQDDQGQDDQHLGNNRKRVDNSPISSPNPDPPRDVALKDIPEATDYMPTTTKTIGNVGAPQHDSLPHLSIDVSEPNIEFAEPSNADLFSHSVFQIFQQPVEEGPHVHDSLPNSNAQVWGGNFQFAEPPDADLFSHSALHVFQQPVEEGPYVLPRDSLPNSNTQVWGGNFQFAEPPDADLFSHSALHLFQQPVEEDPCVLQHDSLPDSNAQASRVGVGLHEPSSADVFPHSSQSNTWVGSGMHHNTIVDRGSIVQISALNAQFVEPLDNELLDEELFARQDKALIGTSPLNLRYLQSLGGHL